MYISMLILGLFIGYIIGYKKAYSDGFVDGDDNHRQLVKRIVDKTKDGLR